MAQLQKDPDNQELKNQLLEALMPQAEALARSRARPRCGMGYNECLSAAMNPLLKLARDPSTYDKKRGSLDALVVKMINNSITDDWRRLRAAGRRGVTVSLDENAPESAREDPALVRMGHEDDFRRIINVLVTAVSVNRRDMRTLLEVIIADDGHRRTEREIAQILGTTERSVHSRLYRIRDALNEFPHLKRQLLELLRDDSRAATPRMGR